MKVVILAGGRGTRLSEETVTRPKPLVEIGGQPILWHIMNVYAAAGHKDFVIACGYKGEMIKEYFADFHVKSGDVTFHLRDGRIDVHNHRGPDWKVTLVDTGLNTQTGGRLLRLRPWVGQEPFMMTYGDGVGNIDVSALARFHETHGKLATITAVRPPSRFGGIEVDGGSRVGQFVEKPQIGEGWINGGFMVLHPDALNYIDGDETIFEREPLERLAQAGQLMAHLHEGFWQPMDTMRERERLEELWRTGNAPWKVWKD